MSTQSQPNSLTSDVAIFQPQNVQTIVQLGPDAFCRNTSSHSACLNAGKALLQRVQTEGMSDALDQEIAKFINKAKITLKNMNERRSPVTQLFDQLRKVYTALENDVDPSKVGTVGYELQSARNVYAARKREEAERLRREEAARQAALLARERYCQEVKEYYKMQFNNLVVKKINELSVLERSVTLENYSDVSAKVAAFDCNIPAEWYSMRCDVLLPAGVNLEDSRNIQAATLRELIPSFCEQFTFEISSSRDEIADRLPSKRAELESIAKASAEEAARIKANIEAKEAEEAARKEKERIEREQKEKAAAALQAQKTEMDSLFGAPIPVAAYEPKVAVKKRISVESPASIMAIIAYWWAQEGQSMPVADLVKTFKKQITFAEKAANGANPVFIDGVSYVDEIKAK